MLRSSVSWALLIGVALATTMLLTGCDGSCGYVDKTYEQCQQELPDKGIACQGLLDRVDYMSHHNGNYWSVITTLRLQDGSSCLLDEDINPQSLNGMPAGTPIKVIWQRIPMQGSYCRSNHRIYMNRCGYAMKLEIGQSEKPQP